MKIKKLVLILIVLLASFMVFADDDTLLLADEPIFYGEENFIERINEKTGGQREPVGVVLSGGSARAYAHIGVLQYLEEQGIVPDYIVSNSMGSIIALLYSAGLSPDQIVQLMTSTDIGQLFDFTLPINTGLLNVDKFKSCICSYLGEDLKLEELAIPVIVVCEDMVTKRQILLAEGDFYDILAASFALPVYFGSVEYENHILIDGGIANLVPLNVAYKYSNNILVSTTFYAGKNLNLKNPLTGLNVSIDIGKRRQGVKELLEHPDVVWVRCNVEDFSFMDFASCKALAQQGYISCQEVSAEISSLAELYNKDDNSVSINTSFREKLITKRTEFEIKMPIVKKNFDIFNRTSNYGTSSMFGVAISSHCDNGYLLRDDLLFGIMYAFSYNNLDLNLVVGGSSKLMSFGYDNYSGNLQRFSHTLPTLNFSLDYYLGNHFKFNVDGTFYYKVGVSKNVQLAHSSLLSESLQYRTGTFNIGSLSGLFKFTARQTLEVTFKNDGLTGSFWDSTLPLSTIVGEFGYDSTVFSALFKAGLQALGWLATPQSRFFGTTYLNVGITPWNVPIKFNLNLNYRVAFDNSGEVPIFPSDGYILADPTLKSQGTAKPITPNAQQYIITSSIAIDWTFYSRKIGLAELILLSNNKIGVFANLLWYKGIVPSAQVGGKISTDVGFLGLKTAPLSVSISYDFGLQKILWTVMFETLV